MQHQRECILADEAHRLAMQRDVLISYVRHRTFRGHRADAFRVAGDAMNTT